MRSELIVMLTNHDKTVEDAIEVFETVKSLPVKFWGFKDVGLEQDKMRTLLENMKRAGKTTFLEVVSYSEEECLRGAMLAKEIGFDYLMGTLYYPSVFEYVKSQGIKYLPFCGKVSQSPSILEGTYDEIIDEAKDMMKKGISGFDLLAYRHVVDGEELAKRFCKAIDAETVIAGSINSFERLDIISDISPWAFTMGTAIFEKRFDSKGTFLQNLERVVEYMDKLE